MSAVDRITAIVAEHYGTAAPNGGWVCNACGAPLVEVGATSRHIAERIASANDLAVIETRQVKVYREGGEWMCETDEEVGSVLPVGAKDWEIDEIEGQLAEAIAQVRAVRAAKAAEAVSDRGDN